MFDHFDPKERKAIMIFLAVLLLIAGYVYTHQLPGEYPPAIPDDQSSLDVPYPDAPPVKEQERFY